MFKRAMMFGLAVVALTSVSPAASQDAGDADTTTSTRRDGDGDEADTKKADSKANKDDEAPSPEQLEKLRSLGYVE